MPDVDESQLIARAVRAYGLPVELAESAVRRLAGRSYVVLAAREPVVYRVHNNGLLRRMIAPPPELLGGES